MAGAEPRYLAHSGFPRFALDLRELDDATLAQASILYLCSPSNPDGNAIGPDVMQRAIEAARRHNFLVVFDECYAELYDGDPPGGALDVLAAMDGSERWLDNVLVLHSLSKRSSAAGMRSGFAVGASDVMAALNRIRLNGTGCTPLPLLAAATALWSEDTHVQAMRARLSLRKDTADRLLGRASRLLPAAVRVLPVDAHRRRPRADPASVARLRAEGACPARFSPRPARTDRTTATPTSGWRWSTTPRRRPRACRGSPRRWMSAPR